MIPKLPERAVEAMEDIYITTADRFDTREDFRVAARVFLAACPPEFLRECADALENDNDPAYGGAVAPPAEGGRGNLTP